jgi:hypothetical protein
MTLDGIGDGAADGDGGWGHGCGDFRGEGRGEGRRVAWGDAVAAEVVYGDPPVEVEL